MIIPPAGLAAWQPVAVSADSAMPALVSGSPHHESWNGSSPAGIKMPYNAHHHSLPINSALYSKPFFGFTGIQLVKDSASTSFSFNQWNPWRKATLSKDRLGETLLFILCISMYTNPLIKHHFTLKEETKSYDKWAWKPSKCIKTSDYVCDRPLCPPPCKKIKYILPILPLPGRSMFMCTHA